MNVLLTSVGRRVMVVRYFREALEGKGDVVAVDCDPTAPALYAANYRETVPTIGDPDYVNRLLAICERYRISAVLSLIDPELTLLATHADRFRERGIRVVVASPASTEICLDKQRTHDLLQDHGIPCVPTYSSMEEIERAHATQSLQFPAIVKPRKGSASIGIMKVHSMADLSVAFERSMDLVVQPFVTGQEYGVDLYVDLVSGEPVSVFTRRKLRMRAGETDRSLAVHEPELAALVLRLAHVLKLIGPNDIDCFQIGERFVISEINPRFGGGYPHAYACGENFVHMLLRNLEDQINVPQIGVYPSGSIMCKYDEVLILPRIDASADQSVGG